MPDTYYTPVNGMLGTGTPAVPAGAVSTSIPTTRTITGGTFTGMEVDSRVRQAIEKGTGSDCFYFENIPENPGYYTMHPKLPEYGAASPDGPLFHLRENNNRLAKGLAQHFLNEEGEVDFQKGLDFLAQIEAAFVANAPSELSDQYTEDFNRSLGWLTSRLQIPAAQRSDFQEYMKTFYLDVDPSAPSNRQGLINLLETWSGWAFSGLNIENRIRSMDSESEAEREAVFQILVDGQSAVDELKAMAQMDPAAQMQAIVITDCNHNGFMGGRQSEAARNARQRLASLGQTPGPSAQAGSPEGPYFGIQFSDETLWPNHTAPVVDSFALDGQTYYLTAESFAPESYSFMKHPGMTSQVSIGVYKDNEDFNRYYSQLDTSLTQAQTGTARWKEEMAGNIYGYDQAVDRYAHRHPSVPHDYLEAVTKEHRKVMNNAFAGKSWDDEYHRQQLSHSSKYQGTMGVNLDQVNHHMDVENRLALRRGMAMTSRIPARYQPLWTSLMGVCSRLMEENNAMDGEKSIYKNVLDQYYDQEDLPTQEILDYVAELDSRGEILRPVQSKLLNALVLNMDRPGLPWNEAFEPSEQAVINQYLEGSGYTCDDIIRMASAVDGHLQQATEVSMIVQAGAPGVGEEFLSQPDPALLSDRAREFAVQNFDEAFGAAFPQEDLHALLEDGRDLLDQIYVGGQNIRELYGREVQDMPPFQAAQTLKCRAMSHILHGDSVRVVPPNWDGYVPLLPVTLSTDSPALSDAILAASARPKALTAEMMDQITASQDALARRSSLEKRKTRLHLEDTRPVYPDMGSAMDTPIARPLPPMPYGFDGDYPRQVYRLYQETGKLRPSDKDPDPRRQDLNSLKTLGQNLFTRISQSAGISDTALQHPIYSQMGIRGPQDLFYIDGRPAVDYLVENRGYSREALSMDQGLLQAEIAAHITSGEHAIDIATVGMDERGAFRVGVQALQMNLDSLNGQEYFFQRSRSTRAKALAQKDATARQEQIRQGFTERVGQAAASHLNRQHDPVIRAYDQAAALLDNGVRNPQVFRSFFDAGNRQSLEGSTAGFPELKRNNMRGVVLMAEMALMAEHPEIRYADLMNPLAFAHEKREMGQKVADAMEAFTGNPSDPRPLAEIRDNCMRALGNFDARREYLYFLGQPETLSPEATETLLRDPAHEAQYHTFMGSMATFAKSSFQLIEQTGSRMPSAISSSLTQEETNSYRRAVNGMVSFHTSAVLKDVQTARKPGSGPSRDQAGGYGTISQIQRSMLAREGKPGKWPFDQTSTMRHMSGKIRDASPKEAADLNTGKGFLAKVREVLEELFLDGQHKVFSAVPEFDFSQLERRCGIHTLDREPSRLSVAYGYMLQDPDLALEDLATNLNPDFLKKSGADFVTFAMEHPVNGPDVTPEQKTASLQAYARMYDTWGQRLTQEPFPDMDFNDPVSCAQHLGKLAILRNLSIDFSQSEQNFQREPDYMDASGGLDQVNRRSEKMFLIQELSKAALDASGYFLDGKTRGSQKAMDAAQAAGTYLMEQYGPLIRGKTPDELIQTLDLPVLQLESINAHLYFAEHLDEARQYLDQRIPLPDLKPDPAVVEATRQATAASLEGKRTALETARAASVPQVPEHPAPMAPGRQKVEGGFAAFTRMEPAATPSRPDRRNPQPQAQRTAQKEPKEPELH